MNFFWVEMKLELYTSKLVKPNTQFSFYISLLFPFGYCQFDLFFRRLCSGNCFSAKFNQQK